MKPSPKHIPKMLKIFLEHGGSGLQKMVFSSCLYSFHLLTLVLGVGSTRGNGGGGDDDQDPEATEHHPWMQLLNENDGVYTLKTLEELKKLKANKNNIARAFRELMRQAWSEYYLIVSIYFLSLILVMQVNQAGREQLLGLILT
jgi:hypothetical protein